jgi:hypothetical protein
MQALGQEDPDLELIRVLEETRMLGETSAETLARGEPAMTGLAGDGGPAE